MSVLLELYCGPGERWTCFCCGPALGHNLHLRKITCPSRLHRCHLCLCGRSPSIGPPSHPDCLQPPRWTATSSRPPWQSSSLSAPRGAPPHSPSPPLRASPSPTSTCAMVPTSLLLPHDLATEDRQRGSEGASAQPATRQPRPPSQEPPLHQ